MEFLHVGKRCTLEFCNQQDFLPFQCEFCGEVYCKDHRRPDDHKCKQGGYASIDDNYVILCPICHFRISMKGAMSAAVLKPGADGKIMTPDELWDKHVSSGECKRQLEENKKNQLPTTCQLQGCKKTMNCISRYRCPKCDIYTCMEHRYDDAHNCGKKSTNITGQNTRMSRLLHPGFFQSNQAPATQVNQQPRPQANPPLPRSNYTPLRQNPPANSAARKPMPPPSNQNAIPDQLEVCPICQACFRSIDLLIEHSIVHQIDDGPPKTSGGGFGGGGFGSSSNVPASSNNPSSAAKAPPKKQTANDQEKCPKCYKRFNVVELVAHMQQEHFIF